MRLAFRRARLLVVASVLAACGGDDAPDTELAIEVVGAPQSGTPGFALAEPVVLRVRDGAGPRAGVAVALEVTDGGVVTPAQATSGADGLISAEWRPGLVTGEQVLTARMSNLPATRIRIEARAFKLDSIATDFLRGCGLKASEIWCWGRTEDGSGRRFEGPHVVMAAHSFRAVALGDEACGLDVAGAVWCHDRSTGVERTIVGLPALSALSARESSACGIAAADSTPWCWQLGNVPAVHQVSTTLHLKSIARGGGGSWPAFGCGLDGDSGAWCWGEGARGQLGDGLATTSATPVRVAGALAFQQLRAGGAHACGLAAGMVYCWGDSTSLHLRRPSSGTPAETGITASRISMAPRGGMSMSGGSTTQWGGGIAQYYDEPQVLQALPGLNLLVFKDLSADESACAIAIDGSAWCSADVFYYQTGYTSPPWLAVPEPGAALPPTARGPR